MARKSISANKKNTIKNMLLQGKTSLEIAELLKISSATVSNYRASFKKQGLEFPNNRGRKPSSITEHPSAIAPKVPTGIRNSSFTYVIDGTNVSFNTRPKTLLISKDRMLVEF